MKAKKLVLCILLALALTVTFIPIVSYGDADDPHELIINGGHYELVCEDEDEGWYYAKLEHGKLWVPFDNDDNMFVALEGDKTHLGIEPDDGWTIKSLQYSLDGNNYTDIEWDDEEGSYTFVLPISEGTTDYDVALKVEFESAIHSITVTGATVQSVYDEEDDFYYYYAKLENGKVYSFNDADENTNIFYGEKGTDYDLSVEPDDGYYVKSVKCYTASGDINVNVDGNSFSFTMPDEDVTIDVGLEKDDDPYDPGDTDENGFEDYSPEWATAADEIALNVPETVDTDEKDGLFKFTPEKDGVYVFYSYDASDEGADPAGRVVDANGKKIESKDDPIGPGFHFQIYFKAFANETYYLQAINYSATPTFKVGLVESDIVSISYTPKDSIQLREDIDGWFNDDDWYWDLPRISNGDQLTLEKKAGSGTESVVYECKMYGDTYDDSYYVFENVNDSEDWLPDLPRFDLEDDWATLADYSAGDQIEVNIKYAELEAPVTVSFVSNPFQSLSISPTVITAQKYCDDSYIGNWSKVSFVFTMKNETKVSYIMDEDGYLFNKATGDYLVPYLDWGEFYDETQGDYVEWEPGKQYDSIIEVAGLEQKIQVKVDKIVGHYWKSESKTPAGLLKTGKDFQRCTYCEMTRNVDIPGWATSYVKKMKVKKGKKSFTVKWKKQSKKNLKKFNGYEIRYSTAANMSGAKTVKAGKKAKSKKIKGLKKKTVYYVQMRSYTVSGGKTYYSPWTTKRVKTK